MSEPIVSATAKNQRALKITFALTFTYFLVEVAGGLITKSLALLADAVPISRRLTFAPAALHSMHQDFEEFTNTRWARASVDDFPS